MIKLPVKSRSVDCCKNNLLLYKIISIGVCPYENNYYVLLLGCILLTVLLIKTKKLSA